MANNNTEDTRVLENNIKILSDTVVTLIKQTSKTHDAVVTHTVEVRHLQDAVKDAAAKGEVHYKKCEDIMGRVITVETNLGWLNRIAVLTLGTGFTIIVKNVWNYFIT